MKTFIIIGGPTNHIDKILKMYNGIDNVIWSTDSSSPSTHLDKIRKSNINLVTIDKEHIFCGDCNFNLCEQTVLAGLDIAQKLGATHCIKMRSDWLCHNMTTLVNICNNMMQKNNKLSFPYLDDLDTKRSKYPTDKWIAETFPNTQPLKHHSYMGDFFICGTIEEMWIWWKDGGDAKKARPVFGEMKALMGYLHRKGYKLNNDKEYLFTIFNFLLPEIQRANLDVYDLKRRSNLRIIHKSSPADVNNHIPQYYRWELNKDNRTYTPYLPDGTKLDYHTPG